MSWATLEKMTTARREEPELRAGGAGRKDVPVAQAEVDGVHEQVAREFFIFIT